MTLDQLAEIARSSKTYILAPPENREVLPQPSADKISAIAAALGLTPGFPLTDGQVDPDDAVLDEALYLRYKQMPPSAKRRLRHILQVLERGSLSLPPMDLEKAGR